MKKLIVIILAGIHLYDDRMVYNNYYIKGISSPCVYITLDSNEGETYVPDATG